MTKASDQFGYDITARLAEIAPRAELIERLIVLPAPVLASVIAAEPDVYARIAGDCQAFAEYLRGLADDFATAAAKLGAGA